jgi:molybdate transport system substrate-binding protein
MKMKRFSYLILLFALLLAGCGPATTSARASEVSTAAAVATPTSAPEPRTLTVYAAASLTGAFGEIGKAFEAAHPGVTVAFNFAGSQTLRAQIEQGAPADVFASANNTEMNTLVTDKKVQDGTPQIFLTNLLVVILPAKNPAGIMSLPDLSKPGLKLVLAADTVPVGKYARQVLENLDNTLGADYKSRVLVNVVSNETDVKQVVAKVQLGEADAGIAYVSDAVAAPELQKIDIPADVNVIAKYPIAPLVDSANADLAADFIAYVLSADGQVTLKKWGFTPVNP